MSGRPVYKARRNILTDLCRLKGNPPLIFPWLWFHQDGPPQSDFDPVTHFSSHLSAGPQRRRGSPRTKSRRVRLHLCADLTFTQWATACIWIIHPLSLSLCTHTRLLSAPAVNLYQMHPNHSAALFFSTLWSFIFSPCCLFDPYLLSLPSFFLLYLVVFHMAHLLSSAPRLPPHA